MGNVRHDGRRANELRPVSITPDYLAKADGSCLIEMGQTRVICTASFTPGVPAWRKGSGLGWMTAEYGMLPAAGGQRKARAISKPDGRSVEIQRIIGRVMRNVVRLDEMGDNTLYLDCDVLQADGGTRTAAITGSFVALSLAAARGAAAGKCGQGVVAGAVAAVSVGIVAGQCMLDLDYVEDSAADVDMNIAQLSNGKFVEIQGSSERRPFDRAELDKMVRLAGAGIRKLLLLQKQAITRAS